MYTGLYILTVNNTATEQFILRFMCMIIRHVTNWVLANSNDTEQQTIRHIT